MSKTAETDGYVRLWRKLMSSNMYKALNSKQRDVMIQCLLMANQQPQDSIWNGEKIKTNPGQFVTSLKKLEDRCAEDVNIRTIRYTIDKLEKWDFISYETSPEGRLITIVNWSKYQDADFEPPKKPKSNEEVNEMLEKRKEKFKEMMMPYKEKYDREILNTFYLYWTEPNKSKSKMRFEMEKTFEIGRRLSTFKRNEIKWSIKRKPEPIEPNYKKNPIAL